MPSGLLIPAIPSTRSWRRRYWSRVPDAVIVQLTSRMRLQKITAIGLPPADSFARIARWCAIGLNEASTGIGVRLRHETTTSTRSCGCVATAVQTRFGRTTGDTLTSLKSTSPRRIDSTFEIRKPVGRTAAL